jgi:hypothetical protein
MVPLLKTTRTYHFNKEFLMGTRSRRRADGDGRLFAGHTIVSCRIVNSIEIRLAYIQSLPLLRGTGMASECLDWICDLADAHQVQITLCPAQMDKNGLDVLMLTAWYQRRGFKRLGFNDEMIRYSCKVDCTCHTRRGCEIHGHNDR